MLRKHPPIIIDVEASGFGALGYPIEVGVVLTDGGKYCSLIRPMPDWVFWDESAERVHRVARDVLEEHGRTVIEVAGALNDLLLEQTVFTDAWVVDKTWLDQLFFAARMPRAFTISSLEMILTERQMEIWHDTKAEVLRDLGGRRHRASFDASVIQETFERTHRATTADALSR